MSAITSWMLTAVRRVLGPQVARLVGPPIRPGADGPFNPFAPEARIGVPVSPFPRWLRCPLCGGAWERLAAVCSSSSLMLSGQIEHDLFTRTAIGHVVLLQRPCRLASLWLVEAVILMT